MENYSFYEVDEDLYNEHIELRKFIVDWLIECNNKIDTEEES